MTQMFTDLNAGNAVPGHATGYADRVLSLKPRSQSFKLVFLAGRPLQAPESRSPFQRTGRLDVSGYVYRTLFVQNKKLIYTQGSP